MHRTAQAVIHLLAIFALVKPLDCFAGTWGHPAQAHAAMKCCLQGKCVPHAGSDSCCQTSAPDQDRVTPNPANPTPDLAAFAWLATHVVAPDLSRDGWSAPPADSPPELGSVPINLPLLI